MVPDQVENQVVTLPACGEILSSVIHDPICADVSDHFQIPRAAYAGHICAEPLSNLHGERTHASCRTVDQDLLPRLNLSLVAKPLQRGECRQRHGGRLLECHVLRLHDQCHSEVHTYSASAPRQVPNTSSPGLNSVTFRPTACTWPATSTPSRVIFGLRRPVIRRTKYGVPLMKCQSSGFMEAARTFIKASCSLGAGSSTSLMWTTSGGPYRS